MWVELIPFYKELVVSGTHPFLQRTRLFKWSCTCFYFMKTVVRNSKSKGTNAKENMVLVQQTSNCKTKETPNFILQWPSQQSMRSTKIQQTYINEFSKKPLPKSKGTNAKENMVLVQQTNNCKTKEAPNFVMQWPTQQSMRSTKI